MITVVTQYQGVSDVTVYWSDLEKSFVNYKSKNQKFLNETPL